MRDNAYDSPDHVEARNELYVAILRRQREIDAGGRLDSDEEERGPALTRVLRRLPRMAGGTFLKAIAEADDGGFVRAFPNPQDPTHLALTAAGQDDADCTLRALGEE